MYNQKNHSFGSFYNHKFGFHITGPRQDAFEAVFRLRPKVVKTLDFSVDVMRRMKQEMPDLFLIGRLFVHPQDYGQLSGGTARDARRRGIEMAERILREEVNRERHHLNGQPIFNAWESLNEVFPEWSDDDTHKLFDEYQVAFGRKMLAAGFEPVAFNFGQGNGRGQQWLQLYPGTLETYTYLGFHEYDWPTMDRLHRIGLRGPEEPQNWVPVVGQKRGNDGMWRCLRYRRIMYEGIRQKFGDKHTAIITECGMTQGVWGGPSRDIGPWAKELSVPRNIPGGVANTPIRAEDYWQTLLWYNSELMKDDFVMGACLFVTGAAGLPEWETFEHLGVITDRILVFQKLSHFDDLPDLTAPEIPPSQPSQPAEPESDAAAAKETSTPAEELPEPVEAESSSPEEDAQTAKLEAEWRYTFETGHGLGLMVGDIGTPGERVTVTRPDGRTVQVTSGSKPEYGAGGFEVYAQQPGSYRIEFLDQHFDLTLSGQFTRVNFSKVEPVVSPPEAEVEDKDKEAPAESVDEASPREEMLPVPPQSVQSEWSYTFETGRGLGLLVGDIGIPGERITITKPDGRWEQVTSGSKSEHGIGGFETYAQQPGSYQIEFLGERFDLTLSGQFTQVTFRKSGPPSASSTPPPPALAPVPEPPPLPPASAPAPPPDAPAPAVQSASSPSEPKSGESDPLFLPKVVLGFFISLFKRK